MSERDIGYNGTSRHVHNKIGYYTVYQLASRPMSFSLSLDMIKQVQCNVPLKPQLVSLGSDRGNT